MPHWPQDSGYLKSVEKNFTILFYQMDHIWGAPSGLKKSPKLTFLDK